MYIFLLKSWRKTDLQGYDNLLLNGFGKGFGIGRKADDDIHFELGGNHIEFLDDTVDIIGAHAGDLQKAVQINLLKIVVLRDDSANETDKFGSTFHTIIVYIDKADFVVELIHMLIALIQIDDGTLGCCHIGIHLVQ